MIENLAKSGVLVKQEIKLKRNRVRVRGKGEDEGGEFQ